MYTFAGQKNMSTPEIVESRIEKKDAQITARLSVDLRRRLERYAKRHHRTVSWAINHLLEQGLEAEDKEKKMATGTEKMTETQTKPEIPPALRAAIRDCEGFVTHPKVLPNGHWAGVLKNMLTGAIVVGTPAEWAYGLFHDRWLYRDTDEAAKALEKWDGSGEPQGWHHHPSTHRRRKEGDARRESVDR